MPNRNGVKSFQLLELDCFERDDPTRARAMLSRSRPSSLLIVQSEMRHSNAITFSKRGTSIRLKAYVDAGKLYFSIKDQGLGIAPEDMGKLFTEFGKTS